jgi:predicted DsbA family dithiol-disulfide isomerase
MSALNQQQQQQYGHSSAGQVPPPPAYQQQQQQQYAAVPDNRPVVHCWEISEIYCFFCAATLRTLEIAALRRGINVIVHQTPHQLDPGMPEEGMLRAPALARKFGPNWRELTQRPLEDLNRKAAEIEKVDPLGRPLCQRLTDDGRIFNTVRAHALILHPAVRAGNLESSLMTQYFQGYFREAADLGKRDVIAHYARRAGVPEAAIQEAVYGMTEERLAELKAQIAADSKVNAPGGIPFFRFENGETINGLHPIETYEAILVRCVEAKHAQQNGGNGNGHGNGHAYDAS